MPPMPEEFDFQNLSVAERILLVERLWDSIALDSQASVPITEEQKRELDSRRLAEEAGEISYSDWNEVKARLLRRKA